MRMEMQRDMKRTSRKEERLFSQSSLDSDKLYRFETNRTRATRETHLDSIGKQRASAEACGDHRVSDIPKLYSIIQGSINDFWIQLGDVDARIKVNVTQRRARPTQWAQLCVIDRIWMRHGCLRVDRLFHDQRVVDRLRRCRTRTRLRFARSSLFSLFSSKLGRAFYVTQSRITRVACETKSSRITTWSSDRLTSGLAQSARHRARALVTLFSIEPRFEYTRKQLHKHFLFFSFSIIFILLAKQNFWHRLWHRDLDKLSTFADRYLVP